MGGHLGCDPRLDREVGLHLSVRPAFAPFKRSILSWSPAGRVLTYESPEGAGNWGTQAYAVSCAADFVAMRFGFVNITPRPYVIPLMKVTSSSSWNNYVNPTGQVDWRTVTVTKKPSDPFDIVLSSGSDTGGASTSIHVAGLDASDPGRGAGRRRWTWTDWVALQAQQPDPQTGRHVVMIRHLMARSGGTFSFMNGQMNSWRGNAAHNHGNDYFIGGYNNGSDFVSQTGKMDRDAALVNGLIGGSIIGCVQFLTVTKGLTGASLGDSQISGDGTTTGVSAFLMQLASKLTKGGNSDLPLGFVQCAVGGASSEEFFNIAYDTLESMDVSFCVMPGWTFNDKVGGANADHAAVRIFFGRLLGFARWCEKIGVLPIWLTPIPRNRLSMGSEQRSAWAWLYAEIKKQAGQGYVVIDVSSDFCNVTNALEAGIWPDGSPYTNDGMHPNDNGHALIAEKIRYALFEM
jgi:hypothetical protein